MFQFIVPKQTNQLEVGYMNPVDSLSILIVEDNSDHAELLSEIMSVLTVKYKLSYAENGHKALEKLEDKLAEEDNNASLPHLVFLDMRMPVLDGIETLKKIRKNAQMNDIKVVMVTTSTIDQEVESCLQSGANAYLNKPVEQEVLIKTLEQLNFAWAVK